MVQKRYQYWSTENGRPVLTWTHWYNYCEDDSMLKTFQKEEAWQLLRKLRNEFRCI